RRARPSKPESRRPLRADAEMTGDPVENELVCQRRIVRVSLRGCGFFGGEDLQSHIAPVTGPDLLVEVADTFGLEPAPFARRDQHRAFDASRRTARPGFLSEQRVALRLTPPEKCALVQIPDTAIADRGGKSVVEGNPARDKGRPPSIRQNSDS